MHPREGLNDASVYTDDTDEEDGSNSDSDSAEAEGDGVEVSEWG